MGRIGNIWFCGYRDWALEIHRQATKSLQIDIPLITSPQKFNLQQTYFKNGDIIFFIGWSWILPKEIVENYKCICLHPSPLPKYRGGSPLQHQIINGEKNSAVTFFLMDEYVDKGPILFAAPFSLDGSLNEIDKRIVKVGTQGLEQIVNEYLREGTLTSTPQDEAAKTYYKRRTPAMSEIKLQDFIEFSAEKLYNKVRALQDPYPNAYITCRNNTKLYLKVVTTTPATGE